MANWMKILAQAIGGKPRKQGGGWHDKWTYEDLMRPDNGEDADPIMFDRFQRQPTTQEQLDAWDRVNQAGPNPMPKLRVKDGKWDPEMVKEMDAWQQRQKEIESQPGYKYEPPLLNGAATQRLKKIATQAVSRQNDEDGRIDTLYSTPTDDPNTATRSSIVDTPSRPDEPQIQSPDANITDEYSLRNDTPRGRMLRMRQKEQVQAPDPNITNDYGFREETLDGRLSRLQDRIAAKQAEKDVNRKANWMQKMGRGLRKFQAGWNGGKGGLVGGFSAALDPTLDEKMNRQQQLNDMFAQYGNLRKMKEAEKADEMQRVNIENIQHDNKLADEQAGWMRGYRTTQTQNTNRTNLFKSPYFDPNNPVHQKQALEAGLDPSAIPAWDNRRPDIRKMGDISYQYKNGRWEQVNVPSNQLRKYTVTDRETGQSETFLVSEAQAAKFKQDMEKTNRTVAAANKRLKMSIEARQALQAQGARLDKETKLALAAYNADRKDESKRQAAQTLADQLRQIQQQLKDDDEAEQ